MKKYILFSFLFLFVSIPVIAKGSSDSPGVNNNTVTPIKSLTVTPTGNQVKNQNEVQTQNQGEDKNLKVKNQENEQLDQELDGNLTKVSDLVHQLKEKLGSAKGGIGQQVREFAQNQIKLQDEIQSDVGQLNSRKTLTKFFIGSDKKLIKTMEQKIEQNRLMIQQLEQLKLETKNTGELQQLQEAIDLMTAQNTSLQDKVETENKINGMFGWLVNLFN